MTGYLVIAGAVGVLLAIAFLLRRRKLREKYTFLWLIVGVVILLLAVFPGILRWASDLAGVQVPSNLLFAVAVVFLAGVCLHLSLEVTAVEDESRILAEELAILRSQFDQFTSASGQAAARDPADPEGQEAAGEGHKHERPDPEPDASGSAA